MGDGLDRPLTLHFRAGTGAPPLRFYPRILPLPFIRVIRAICSIRDPHLTPYQNIKVFMETKKYCREGRAGSQFAKCGSGIAPTCVDLFYGCSGSGKSSMAFDTIYAEGQRRYVESLSAYARQFLGQMEKPEVDQITGLSPTISIEQKTAGRNPRSTVGTITRNLRLFARAVCAGGHAALHLRPHADRGANARWHCGSHYGIGAGARIHILASLVQGPQRGIPRSVENLQKEGYIRVRVTGRWWC